VDLGASLRDLGLERYEAFRDNDIAPAVLPELRREQTEPPELSGDS
jgi:hypothetical protein